MGFADALAKASLENHESATATHFVSTGDPNLDAALSGRYKDGGFACGRVVEIFGPSASGKTLIAINVMSNVQKLGGLAGFNDHERTFAAPLAESQGLSLDPNKWVYSKPFTYEQSIDLMREKVLLARGMEFKDGVYRQKKGATIYYPIDKPIVWVFDSLHAMVPMSAADKAATERTMHDNTALSRVNSAQMPAIALFAEATNTLVIFLNQIRMKFGSNPKYPVYFSPGGDTAPFYMSQRLRLTANALKDKATGEELGNAMTCKVIKNKVYRPNLKVEWDFLYQPDGTGKIDVTGAVLERVIALGKLEQAGPRITWTDGVKYFRKALIKKIDEEGLRGELFGMLPETLAQGAPGSEVISDDEADELVAGFAAAAEKGLSDE